jgi:hypothetical protein
MADRLVTSLYENGNCGFSPGLETAHAKWLGLDPEGVEALREEVHTQIAHAKELLGLLR